MSKNNGTNIQQYLQIISQYAYQISVELQDGLPGGNSEELGFDEVLVQDIAKAFVSWKARNGDIKDPYCVWFYNGSSWSKVTGDLYQEDAYREWYRFTSGGKKLSNPSNDTYYLLASSKSEPVDRGSLEKEEDDFSIRYLLNKSFGE